jgi:hypothetical protein
VLKLEQKYFPFKKVSMAVNDERELMVTSSSLSNKTSVTIPIDILTPRPIEYRHLKVVAISIFIISTVLSLVSAYILSFSNISDDVGVKALVALLVFGTFSFVSLVKLQGAYKNLLIYNDKRTNESIVFLSPNKPSKKAVDKFVDSLEEKIKSIVYGQNLNDTEMLVIYKKHLEFLLSEEVITEKEFDELLNRAKNKSDKKVVSLVLK